jgi:N-acetyltransferase
MFELQPTLTGNLLELRPLCPDDFEELYLAASDPLIWEQHPANDRYKKDVFRKFFAEALESGGAFAVVDLANGHIIGSSRYHAYKPQSSEIEIGWTFLTKNYWGGTFNREMKTLMLEHAFKFVKKVVFMIGPHNVRSQMAMEKIGGTRIDSRLNQRGEECVVYLITE